MLHRIKQGANLPAQNIPHAIHINVVDCPRGLLDWLVYKPVEQTSQFRYNNSDELCEVEDLVNRFQSIDINNKPLLIFIARLNLTSFYGYNLYLGLLQGSTQPLLTNIKVNGLRNEIFTGVNLMTTILGIK